MANRRYNTQIKPSRMNAMGGGMMRKMYSKGSGNGNSKKGDLGMQSVIHGLDNNPDITKADPKAKFIAKNKPKTITGMKPTLGLKKTEEYKKKLKEKNKGKK